MKTGSLTLQINWPQLKERVYQYGLLVRFHRPIGTLLLLWPMLSALWIAGEGKPDLHVLIIFILGTFCMRSAGCAINDYADRKIDPHVARTKDRPIATGAVSPKEAVYLALALAVLSFFLVLTLNWLTIGLSFIGVLLAATYPYMKRYTYLPQMYLGATFGWAIPMAFAAQTGDLPKVAWLMYISAILWATVYDTMYGMVDREEDIRLRVKSTAILFGDADRVILGILQLIMLLTWIVIGVESELGVLFYLGLIAAAGLAAYHQYLIRKRERDQCFKAFLHNNWLGLAIFIGIFLDYLVRA